jgi:hypothetical protein
MPPALTIADRASSTTFERIGVQHHHGLPLLQLGDLKGRLDGFDVERRKKAGTAPHLYAADDGLARQVQSEGGLPEHRQCHHADSPSC